MKYKTVELNREIISWSTGIQTNWHVITGTPCSGKTTLIDIFTNMGFKTVPETGRQYIERELLEEIRRSTETFLEMLEMRLDTEHGLDPKTEIILDRALPDFLTFARTGGLDPNNYLNESLIFRYKSVYILDRLPIEHDGVRAEDEATQEFMDEWLERDYATIGYDVIRVPIMSIEDRLEYLRDRMQKQGEEK
jgi:predicted ATPase